jgi:hypothetical protein
MCPRKQDLRRGFIVNGSTLASSSDAETIFLLTKSCIRRITLSLSKARQISQHSKPYERTGTLSRRLSRTVSSWKTKAGLGFLCIVILPIFYLLLTDFAGWLIQTSSSSSCDRYEEARTHPHQRCSSTEGREDTLAVQMIACLHASRHVCFYGWSGIISLFICMTKFASESLG